MGAHKKRVSAQSKRASEPARATAQPKGAVARSRPTAARAKPKGAESAAPQPRRVTAQPRPLSQDIGAREPTEEGLSIEPEEMGQSFLRYATEQGNYETERGAGAAELTLDSEPATDDPLDGPNFSADASVWSNTVAVTSSTGGRIEDVARAAEPSTPSDEPELGHEENRAPRRGVMEIDLSESVIEEASLLDEESDVLGEVIPKEPRTDDAHHKSRPR